MLLDYGGATRSYAFTTRDRQGTLTERVNLPKLIRCDSAHVHGHIFITAQTTSYVVLSSVSVEFLEKNKSLMFLQIHLDIQMRIFARLEPNTA